MKTGMDLKKAPYIIMLLCLLSGSDLALIAGTLITGICIVLKYSGMID